jgi:single-stranded-DNA-specific exonuclease
VNKEAVQLLADSGCKLIVTVDCGIRSPEETNLANKLGVDMIISDHHYPKGDLPKALAVICPKREDDNYPTRIWPGLAWRTKLPRVFLRGVKRAIGALMIGLILWRLVL